MIEGWSYYAFAYMDDPMHKFGGIKPQNGFVKQEAEKLIKQAKDVWQAS